MTCQRCDTYWSSLQSQQVFLHLPMFSRLLHCNRLSTVTHLEVGNSSSHCTYPMGSNQVNVKINMSQKRTLPRKVVCDSCILLNKQFHGKKNIKQYCLNVPTWLANKILGNMLILESLVILVPSALDRPKALGNSV